MGGVAPTQDFGQFSRAKLPKIALTQCVRAILGGLAPSQDPQRGISSTKGEVWPLVRSLGSSAEPNCPKSPLHNVELVGPACFGLGYEAFFLEPCELRTEPFRTFPQNRTAEPQSRNRKRNRTEPNRLLAAPVM